MCNIYDAYANLMADQPGFSSLNASSAIIIPWKHLGLLMRIKYYIFPSRKLPFDLG